MNDRIEEGAKIVDLLHKNGAQKIKSGLGAISNDLEKNVLGFVFGTIYAKEGLDLKTKQMLTITILATLGNARPQLEYHIKAGLNLGLTRQEIIDIMIHISAYAGFPACLNGANAAQEVFKRIDEDAVKSA